MNKFGLENAQEMMRGLLAVDTMLRTVLNQAGLGGWFYVRSDLQAARAVLRAAMDNLQQEVYLENGGEGVDTLPGAVS